MGVDGQVVDEDLAEGVVQDGVQVTGHVAEHQRDTVRHRRDDVAERIGQHVMRPVISAVDAEFHGDSLVLPEA